MSVHVYPLRLTRNGNNDGGRGGSKLKQSELRKLVVYRF